MSENKQRWIFSKKKYLEDMKKEICESWVDKCDGKPVEFKRSKTMGLCVGKNKKGVSVSFVIDKDWCEKVEQNE